MSIQRFSLRDCDFDTFSDVSGKCKTIQDHTTTTKAMVMRLANGVVSADALRNGCTYTDLGLPAHLDRFQVMDMMVANHQRIKDLQDELATPPADPADPADPAEPPAT